MWRRTCELFGLVIIIFACCAAGANAQQTLHVPAGYLTIQQAIDAASQGDTVEVAAGTYNERIDFKGKAIRVKGAGMNSTVIDGAGFPGSVVTFKTGETNASILELFTIKNGSGTIHTDGKKYGGGIFIVNSSPYISFCKVINNNSTHFTGTTPEGRGGGIAVIDPNNLVQIYDCDVIDNIANRAGGGVWARGNVTIAGGQITQNTSGLFGGGAFLSGGIAVMDGPAILQNSTGAAQVPAFGGGVYIASTCTASIVHCTLNLNQASGNGGAISVGDGNAHSVTLNHSEFNNNSAMVGGAVLLGSGGTITKTISNCTFHNNSSSSSGGAVGIAAGAKAAISNCEFTYNEGSASGGAISILATILSPATCDILDSKFLGNTGFLGAGIHSQACALTLARCDFTKNEALKFSPTPVALGGAAYCYLNPSTSFTDCNFYENQAANGGGGIYARQASGMLTFDRCVFWKNRATETAHSDAAFLQGAGELRECVFVENGLHSGGGAQGDAAVLALVAADITKTWTARKCVFLDNAGGGLAAGGNVIIERVTVAGNAKFGLYLSAATSPLDPNGTLTKPGNVQINSSIFWGNQAAAGGAKSIAPGPAGSSWSATYSDIQDAAITPGIGNIKSDPELWGMDGFDALLLPGSPCIHAGDPALPPNGDGSRAHMGARESVDLDVINHNNQHRYITWREPVTLAEALEFADAQGGSLAVIQDAAEQQFLESRFGRARAWIGYNDEHQEGVFVADNGQPVLYTNWNENEPDNAHGGEDRVILGGIPGKWGKWSDVSESGRYYPMVETGDLMNDPVTLLEEPSGGGVAAHANIKNSFMLKWTAGESFQKVSIQVESPDLAHWKMEKHEGSEAWVRCEFFPLLSELGAHRVKFIVKDNGVPVSTLQTVVEIQVLPPPMAIPNQSHHYIITDTAMTAQSARLFANSIGGYLASIGSAAENEFLTMLTGHDARASYWIGLSDVVAEGNYQWDSGEPPGFNNWWIGEPGGDQAHKDFVQFNDEVAGTWKVTNGHEMARAIIEVPNPEPWAIHTAIVTNVSGNGAEPVSVTTALGVTVQALLASDCVFGPTPGNCYEGVTIAIEESAVFCGNQIQYITISLKRLGGASAAHWKDINIPGFTRMFTAPASGEWGRMDLAGNIVGKANFLFANPAALNCNNLPVARTAYPVGPAPIAVVSRDFNQDGLSDFAVANNGNDTITLLAGNGAGGFAAWQTLPVDGSPNGIEAGDLNGDGRPDLVTRRFGGAQGVGVLLAQPGGNFASEVSYFAGEGNGPNGIADFNLDGIPDLAHIGFPSPSAFVAPGTGSGTFLNPVQILQMPNHSASMAVADFNVDGAPDVAVSIYYNNEVRVLLGDGAGGLSTGIIKNIGTVSGSLAVTDLNGDGIPDMVSANTYTDTCGLLVADVQTGNYQYSTIPGGYNPVSLKLADVNRDGIADVVLASYLGNSVSVILANAQAGFLPIMTLGGEVFAGFIEAGDFNGDGASDWAIVNSQLNGTLSVYLNQSPAPTGLSNFGWGTAGCRGALGITANQAPAVGAPNFKILFTNVPASSAGILLITNSQDPGGSDWFALGIKLHADLVFASEIYAFDIVSDLIGASSVTTGIPNIPQLAGSSYFACGLFAEFTNNGDACSASAYHLVSSRGLQLTLQ